MKPLKSLTNLSLGAFTGYSFTLLAWVGWQLARANPHTTLLTSQNRASKGLTALTSRTAAGYAVQHVIEDGIERISYFPQKQRFETPILMLHGMWHGAWCWQPWQELLAEWGWENHAISLPGHGKSPVQRPIPLCTLDYYLDFVRSAVNQLPRKPILLGHSMGGALTQWYLKYVGDDLPAAVFVASWVSHSVRADGGVKMLTRDPAIMLGALRTWDASSWVRNPRRAAELLLGPKAAVSPQELQPRLGPESILVAFQHNPPFWQPPENVQTPNLWLAGELDAASSVPGLRNSAAHYGGDFVLIPEAGHNLMMEYNAHQTAQIIHDWFTAQEIE